MELKGRRVLLTGAGSGIGRSLALQLAEHQARLVLLGRREGPLEDVAAGVRKAGGEAHVVSADLTDAGAPERVMKAALQHLGGLDILINNAGNVRAGRLERSSEDEVTAQIALNLTAPILLTRSALEALRDSGEGLIVNISSAIALVGLPFYSVYAATKAGIAHFGEALRRELHGEGVGVLTVYPGATRTPMMESSQAGPEHGFDHESPDAVADAVVQGILDGELSLIRGGEQRKRMITANQEDPGAVDEMLAESKGVLEAAVSGHSSL